MEKHHLKYIMTMLIQTPGGEASPPGYRLLSRDVCMYVCMQYVCMYVIFFHPHKGGEYTRTF